MLLERKRSQEDACEGGDVKKHTPYLTFYLGSLDRSRLLLIETTIKTTKPFPKGVFAFVTATALKSCLGNIGDEMVSLCVTIRIHRKWLNFREPIIFS